MQSSRIHFTTHTPPQLPPASPLLPLFFPVHQGLSLYFCNKAQTHFWHHLPPSCAVAWEKNKHFGGVFFLSLFGALCLPCVFCYGCVQHIKVVKCSLSLSPSPFLSLYIFFFFFYVFSFIIFFMWLLSVDVVISPSRVSITLSTPTLTHSALWTNIHYNNNNN